MISQVQEDERPLRQSALKGAKHTSTQNRSHSRAAATPLSPRQLQVDTGKSLHERSHNQKHLSTRVTPNQRLKQYLFRDERTIFRWPHPTSSPWPLFSPADALSYWNHLGSLRDTADVWSQSNELNKNIPEGECWEVTQLPR